MATRKSLILIGIIRIILGNMFGRRIKVGIIQDDKKTG